MEKQGGLRRNIVAGGKTHGLVLMLLLMLALLLSGCEKKTPVQKKLKIGVTLYDQYDTFLSALISDFEQAASQKRGEGYEINIELYNAAGSQRSQNDQVEEMLQNGCDVLCVNLVDRTAPTEIIEMAKRQDVPVIFFNRELVEEDLKQWSKLYYVGADAFQSGTMEGELAADRILSAREDGISAYDKNRDGLIQYVVMEGEAGHQDAIVRSEYSVNTLVEKGARVDKLGYALGNWNRAEAQAKMNQLYDTFGDRIELVMCNNDEMALGVIDAYAGREIPLENRPLIYGIDGTEGGLEAVREGTLAGTVFNDGRGQAENMFQLAFQLGFGGDLSELPLIDGKYIRLPYEKIDLDNVEDFVKRTS